MKLQRWICAALAVVLALALVACGGASSSSETAPSVVESSTPAAESEAPESEPVESGAPVLAQNPLGDIVPADFDVYDDTSRTVIGPVEFEDNTFVFADAADYGFEPERLSTRRGVRLGDSAADVADAYAGLSCLVMTVDDTDESGSYTQPDFATYMANHDSTSGIVGITYSHYVVDGEVVGWDDFYRLMEYGEYQGRTVTEEPEDVLTYSLVILLKDGEVISININYVDFGDL